MGRRVPLVAIIAGSLVAVLVIAFLVVRERELKDRRPPAAPPTASMTDYGRLRQFFFTSGGGHQGGTMWKVTRQLDGSVTVLREDREGIGVLKERKTAVVPVATMERLGDLLQELEIVPQWSDFNEQPTQVISDPPGFTLEAEYEHVTVKATGILKYPSNYEQAVPRLKAYLATLT